VFFCGQDVSLLDERRQGAIRGRSIGRVFQSFCLLPRRSVLENVLFRFRYLDVPRADALAMACRAVEDVGLSPRAGQAVRLLSGGEMQRVAIARAVALPPALLLVDEPTGNLDAESARIVMEQFRRLNAKGITIVLVTHNPAVLAYCGRRLACVGGWVRAGQTPPAGG
jgi:putative ABC transport system ATP-binding protein